MRKKPDIILLLTVIVISGVIISNLTVIKHRKQASARLTAQHQKQNPTSRSPLFLRSNHSARVNVQEFVRIDSSKQQTR